MGLTGSMTAKADVLPCFASFTTWDKSAVEEMFYRSEFELADTFALRSRDFDLLVGLESHRGNVAEMLKARQHNREVFGLFESKKGICDKYEVLCALTFLSDISCEAKVVLLFELFNFNKKGFLLPNEIHMLLLSSIHAAKIVDRLLNVADAPKNVEILVTMALAKYAIIDPQKSVWKQEFILFTKEVRKVQSFLDVWGGRVGQVVISENCQWDDLHFDASDLSIIPSEGWLVQGLPPKGFIHWIRTSDVKASAGLIGCTTLFDSSVELSKRVKSGGYLRGNGALGRGYLKQGLLSDRYILNGLAICMPNSRLIQKLFTPTNQETSGRYCLRIFEGGGWRSVFIDNTIPCTASGIPSFLHSSDPFECWPMLLEKAYAKYFGSYGHLAMNSSRGDAALTAARLLTGGHVYRLCTYDLIWKTGYQLNINNKNRDKDGYVKMQRLINEGSLVSFGRSEVLAFGQPPLRDSHQGMTPHGRLFPVVGIIQPDLECVYMNIIFRDPWNIIATDGTVPGPDDESGQFRTFRIKVEEIPLMFDTMIVCRYPDIIRTERLQAMDLKKKIKATVPVKNNASSSGKSKNSGSYKNNSNNSSNNSGTGGVSTTLLVDQPWQTEVARAQTYSTKDPARFLLIIEDIKNVFVNDLKISAAQSAEKGLNSFQGAGISSYVVDDMLVDVAITISSCFDWVMAGSAEAGAEIRFRIVASDTTLDRAAERKDQLTARALYLEEKQKRIEEQILDELREQERIELQASKADSEKERGLNGTDSSAPSRISSVKTKEDGLKRASVGAIKLSAEVNDESEGESPVAFLTQVLRQGSNEAVVETPTDIIPPPIEEDYGIYSFGQMGSWMSATPLLLYPGEYFIYADVTFKAPIESLRSGLKKSKDMKETPWVEDIAQGQPSVWAVCTADCVGRLQLSEIPRVVKLPVNVKGNVQGNKGAGKGKLRARSDDSSSGNQDTDDDDSATTNSDNRSKGSQSLSHTLKSANSYTTYGTEEGSLSGPLLDLSDIIIQPSRWPFSTEIQSETATSGLYTMLSDLRSEAETLAAEFISTARRLNVIKKQLN